MSNTTEWNDLEERVKLSEGADFSFDVAGAVTELAINKGNTAPMIVRILSIAGGLMAAATFMFFLAIADILDSEYVSTAFGVILIIGSLWVNRFVVNIVLDTLSISMYGIGFLLVMVGVVGMGVEEDFVAVLAMMMAIGSFSALRSKVLAFITVLIFNGAFMALALQHELYVLVQVYVLYHLIVLFFLYMEESTIILWDEKWAKLYRSVCSGFILSLLPALFLLMQPDLFSIEINHVWMTSLLNIGLILFVILKIMRSYDPVQGRYRPLIFVLSLAALIPLVLAPGVIGCLFIILLTYYGTHKTGFVIGALSFIYFIVQYYYELSFTLLVKSGILFLSGVLCLIAFIIVNKIFKADEKI